MILKVRIINGLVTHTQRLAISARLSPQPGGQLLSPLPTHAQQPRQGDTM